MARVDDDPPGPVARAVRGLLLLMYRMRGWKAVGVVPEPRRFIIIAAPHTSNWDFVNFLGLTADLGIRAHFMGKLSLFKWPLARFMKQMGGVPVDQRGGGNMVQQMVDEFARRSERKSRALYAAIDGSGGFYRNEVAPAARSRSAPCSPAVAVPEPCGAWARARSSCGWWCRFSPCPIR